ncbi:MAG: alpha/beta hydrolase [Rhodospirillaceae bacterium]
MTLDDWKKKLGGGRYLEAGGCRFHYARMGQGRGGGAPTVLLIHGWPEFWLAWRKNMPVLAKSFDVIAPDLRGFGESRSTDRPADALLTPDIIADDLIAFLDTLGLGRVAVAAHDVGAQAAQALAKKVPERIAGLFFFNCPYGGIGKRWADPESMPETWYQYFNQLPMAPLLAGLNRNACRLYFGHILSHWSHDPDTFAGDLDLWVDNFMAPGALEGGFAWYRGVDGIRRGMVRRAMAGDWPDADPNPIAHPTCIRWGEHDPVLRAGWMDSLGGWFSSLDAAVAPSAGHFVHYETPDAANAWMVEFFSRL